MRVLVAPESTSLALEPAHLHCKFQHGVSFTLSKSTLFIGHLLGVPHSSELTVHRARWAAHGEKWTLLGQQCQSFHPSFSRKKITSSQNIKACGRPHSQPVDASSYTEWAVQLHKVKVLLLVPMPRCTISNQLHIRAGLLIAASHHDHIIKVQGQ